MFLIKTLLVAAALAGGLLTSPPAAAAKPSRIPEPPPRPSSPKRLCLQSPLLRIPPLMHAEFVRTPFGAGQLAAHGRPRGGGPPAFS